MNKVLFAHSYFYKFDEKQWKNQTPYPPLGTIFAASFLRENGFPVALFDTNLVDGPDELLPALDAEKPGYLVLYDDGFNYLTKMCLTNMREAAFEMSKEGKQRGCTVIVCSSDSTDHSESYLNEGADFILRGEGELTLLELLQELEKGTTAFDEIQGIAYKKEGEVVMTTKRPVLRELDTLPQPAWDLVDVEAYRSIWMNAHGFFSLNLATTRGCPFKCNWCAKPIYGNWYNSRSPKRVVEEIAMLNEKFGVDYFWMCDDIFGLKPGWVQEFRDLLKERQLKIGYKIQSRVDLLLKEDTIDALAESGLDEVWVGAESGSQKILDAMDKGTQVEQIYEATRLLKKKGVRIAFFLQFGYLGEQREDINKTIRMVEELLPDDIGISVSYPLPGTAFYDKVKAELSNKANWTDSDDLDLMFEGTYSRAFYKKLHRYVHKVYRRKQGTQRLKAILKNPFKVPAGHWRSAFALAYYTPGVWMDRMQLRKLESEA